MSRCHVSIVIRRWLPTGVFPGWGWPSWPWFNRLFYSSWISRPLLDLNLFSINLIPDDSLSISCPMIFACSTLAEFYPCYPSSVLWHQWNVLILWCKTLRKCMLSDNHLFLDVLLFGATSLDLYTFLGFKMCYLVYSPQFFRDNMAIWDGYRLYSWGFPRLETRRGPILTRILILFQSVKLCVCVTLQWCQYLLWRC